MFVMVEDRPEVSSAYLAGFEREGVCAINFGTSVFGEWFDGLSPNELAAIEAFIVGEAGEKIAMIGRRIRMRVAAPLIALLDRRTLDDTLALLDASFDDVLGKPVHAREILARTSAIRRRNRSIIATFSEIAVFADGRDTVVGGETLPLPRRERRILECLAESRSAWITKSQIFSRVYGIHNDEFDENVVESHVCRLRRRLRMRLGYDPIESQRFLGYRLVLQNAAAPNLIVAASSVQPPKARVEMKLSAIDGG
ncbi:MAG: response regulator transcription factor [Hyphomicrobium sp.]